MKQLKSLVVSLLVCLAFGTALAANDAPGQSDPTQDTAQVSQAGLPDRVVSSQDDAKIVNGFDGRYLHKTNWACGMQPIPPMGCKVGACVCDTNGNNCQWTMICK